MLEKGTRAVVTSDRVGLPKPWHPDSIQTLAAAPAPAPDMMSPLVLAAAPKVQSAPEEARKLALRLGQASAAVAATMGKAKILGLIIDRREVGDVGAFDGFTDEQLVEEAAKRARELGIAGPRLVENDNNKPR
jgi:hypothetical protein